MQKHLPIFNANLYYILKQYIILLLLLATFRALILLTYGPDEIYSSFKIDILKAFIYGIRYDSVVLLYCLLLPTALAVIGIIISPLTDKLEKSVIKVGLYYMPIVYLFLVAALIGDYYYFGYYQTHFNIIIFGLWEDDTRAILSSMYHDFPVIKIGLTLIFIIYLIIKLNRYIYKKHAAVLNKSYIFSGAFFLLFSALYFFGMRGTLYGRVLCLQENGVISSNNFINDLMPNGLFTLREALEQRYKNNLPTDVNTVLRNYNIADSNQMLSEYKQLLQNDSDFYWATTKPSKFLEKNKPNIIFIQMESFGGDLLRYQSPEFNLLGTFENEYKNALVFNNFKCGNIMTIHSLEGLVINALMTPVSYTKNYRHFYQSSNMRPYLDNNYYTEFVTGGRLSWHNMDKFLQRQGFKETIGSEAIKKEIPASIEKEWGIADEYMFDYILKRSNAIKTPHFIYAMSISNHTPYDIPEHYQSPKITPPDSLIKRFKCNMDVARRNIASYRYANDCLGNFMKKFRESPQAANTIIVITGDHFCHDLFNYSEDESSNKYSVPLIIIIPDQYKKNISNDVSRFGSHKDIFPTLFNLSLSNTKYFNAGNNLLSTDANTNFFAFTKTTPMSNDFCIIDKNGFVCRYGKQFTQYKWDGKSTIKATNTNALKELNILERKGTIYNAALDFHQINEHD